MNDLPTLEKEERELLIRTYANRMEQAMNKGDREAAVIYMNAMYETIKVRNAALLTEKPGAVAL